MDRNKINYNKQKDIQLLQNSEDLKKNGKHLIDENYNDYLELIEYDICIENHVFWTHREEISSLMTNFLSSNINGEEFCDQVYGLRLKVMKLVETLLSDLRLEKLNDFQLDLRAEGFSRFCSGLYSQCEYFEDDYQNNEFYTSIYNGFLNFQKTFRESEKPKS